MILKNIAAFVGAAVVAGGFTAPASAGVVTVKGSDTMVILAQKWAEEFMKANPGTTIQVTGGGSGTGAAALVNGTTDIANMSREMTSREKSQIRSRANRGVSEFKMAKDGLSIYVHPSNNVPHLTFDQLKGIYTGRINNWSQVGGPNLAITRYSRENNSGTYVFFKQFVLGGSDYHVSCQNLPGTASVVNAVARDRGGIGYGGLAYTKGVRDVPIKKTANSPAVEPNFETVQKGTYPIWRPLYMYTIGVPRGETKKFIDWCLSPAGQALVKDVGYIPIK